MAKNDKPKSTSGLGVRMNDFQVKVEKKGEKLKSTSGLGVRMNDFQVKVEKKE
jgi:hypothetical protein